VVAVVQFAAGRSSLRDSEGEGEDRYGGCGHDKKRGRFFLVILNLDTNTTDVDGKTIKLSSGDEPAGGDQDRAGALSNFC
jgi:hypothetical protein